MYKVYILIAHNTGDFREITTKTENFPLVINKSHSCRWSILRIKFLATNLQYLTGAHRRKTEDNYWVSRIIILLWRERSCCISRLLWYRHKVRRSSRHSVFNIIPALRDIILKCIVNTSTRRFAKHDGPRGAKVVLVAVKSRRARCPFYYI